MRQASKLTVVMAATALTVITVGGVAIATSAPSTIKACAAKSGGALRLAKHCKSSENKVTWNVNGPQGAQGPQGIQGNTGGQGIQGIQGIQGPAGVAHIDYAIHTCTNNADGTQSSCSVACPSAGEVAIGGGGLAQGGFADHQELNSSVPTDASGSTIIAGETPAGWKVYVDNGVGGSNTTVIVYVQCISGATTTVTSSLRTNHAVTAK